MKIGIRLEPTGGSLGGAEVCAATMAEALGAVHEVEIVHHRSALTVEQLAEFSGTDLRTTRLRYVDHEPYHYGDSRNPWKRYRGARAWYATLSEPYDLFVNFTHSVPPFCHASRGMLMILFPFDEAMYVHLRRASPNLPPFVKNPRYLYQYWEWRKRFGSYQIITANSEFTRTWTGLKWGVDSHVLYPPVDIHSDATEKTNAVISAGRFTTTAHTKKQSEMMAAFQQMKDAHGLGWEYFCVGAIGDSPADREYFERVRRMGEAYPAHTITNLSRAHLKRLFAQSKVFWHATGYGEDHSDHPELTEHFGMVTVEAMAAGCVPVVINKGGQPEIVQHGVSGFLWDTVDELKEYTMRLVRDDRLRSQMSEAARERAKHFGRDAFVARTEALLRPLL